MRYYAKSTNGFYQSELNAGSIPADAVEISESEWQELKAAFAENKRIAFGEDGRPVVAELAPFTREELAAQAQADKNALLRAATAPIAPLQDAVDLGVATPAEVARLTAWKEYRVDLSRIQDQPGYPVTFIWPEAPDGK